MVDLCRYHDTLRSGIEKSTARNICKFCMDKVYTCSQEVAFCLRMFYVLSSNNYQCELLVVATYYQMILHYDSTIKENAVVQALHFAVDMEGSFDAPHSILDRRNCVTFLTAFYPTVTLQSKPECLLYYLEKFSIAKGDIIVMSNYN